MLARKNDMNPNECFDAMVEVARLLAEQHPLPFEGSDYLRILEGTVRKNLLRAQASEILTKQKWLSNSALELTRNMIEDVIEIEYVLKDRDRRAEKFIAYQWVESKNDFDQFKLSGVSTDKLFFENSEQVNDQYYEEAVQKYPQFKKNRTWAGLSADQMFEKLADELGGADQVRIISQTYAISSRHTHFSPTDIHSYLDPDNLGPSNDQSHNLVVIIVPAMLGRVCSRYLDEIDRLSHKSNHEDMRQTIKSVLERLHSFTLSDIDSIKS